MKLSNEQDAIKQAIEAGWKPKDWDFPSTIFDGTSKDGTTAMFVNKMGDDASWWEYDLAVILSDPAFWQALGKARGWRKRDSAWAAYDQFRCKGEEWKYYAHEWLETLLSSGSTEDFWKSLP